jgi:hypothetical protein
VTALTLVPKHEHQCLGTQLATVGAKVCQDRGLVPEAGQLGNFPSGLLWSVNGWVHPASYRSAIAIMINRYWHGKPEPPAFGSLAMIVIAPVVPHGGAASD